MFNNNLFNIMFMIVPIISIGIIAFVIVMMIKMFNPKSRSKMMGKSLESLKYMMEENADLLQDLSKTSTNLQKNILDENEDTLRDIATKKAKINKDAIEITAEAIKKGLSK